MEGNDIVSYQTQCLSLSLLFSQSSSQTCDCVYLSFPSSQVLYSPNHSYPLFLINADEKACMPPKRLQRSTGLLAEGVGNSNSYHPDLILSTVAALTSCVKAISSLRCLPVKVCVRGDDVAEEQPDCPSPSLISSRAQHCPRECPLTSFVREDRPTEDDSANTQAASSISGNANTQASSILSRATDLTERLAFRYASLVAKLMSDTGELAAVSGLMLDFSQHMNMLLALLGKVASIPPDQPRAGLPSRITEGMAEMACGQVGPECPLADMTASNFEAQRKCLLALAGDWAFLRHAFSWVSDDPRQRGLPHLVIEVSEGRLLSKAMHSSAMSQSHNFSQWCCCNVRCSNSSGIVPRGIPLLLRGTTCGALRNKASGGRPCFAWFCSTKCLTQAHESGGHKETCSYLDDVAAAGTSRDPLALEGRSMGDHGGGGGDDPTRGSDKDGERASCSSESMLLPLAASQTAGSDSYEDELDEILLWHDYLKLGSRPYSGVVENGVLETEGPWLPPEGGNSHGIADDSLHGSMADRGAYLSNQRLLELLKEEESKGYFVDDMD